MPSFTQVAIKQSFLKLLEQYPISKITVKMIVLDCGINRNTFYYHFEDIPMLLEEVIEDQIDVVAGRLPDECFLEEIDIQLFFVLLRPLHVGSRNIPPNDIFTCFHHVRLIKLP